MFQPYLKLTIALNTVYVQMFVGRNITAYIFTTTLLNHALPTVISVLVVFVIFEGLFQLLDI